MVIESVRTIFGRHIIGVSLLTILSICFMARAEDGSQVVAGGGEITYTGASETGWVNNSDGSKDFLIIFKDTENPGSFTFPGTTKARILAIGGGGGGAGSYGRAKSPYGGGGGGGAGGLVETNDLFSAGDFGVTVGAGGTGGAKTTSSAADATGGTGGTTSVRLNEKDWLTAYGGGGGGAVTPGKDGGSGGGGSQTSAGLQQGGGKGTAGQGHDGGVGNKALFGGGGGGAGADEKGKGTDASESGGGKGGDGVKNDITGADVWYAGGGGGGYIGTETIGLAIPGGQGGGGDGGYGKAAAPSPGKNGLGGGGGGCNASTFAGADGGSGVVIVRIAGSIAGGLDKPTDVTYKYDGKEHTSYQTSPFYTVDGTSTATEVGVYPVTVTPVGDIKWSDGSADPVSVTMTIYASDSKSGTELVTGFPVQFVGASEVSRVGDDLLLKFTDAGTFTLPGTTKARMLVIGGGGGGAGSYGRAKSPYGGGGGGGAGGLVETNAMFVGATYAVIVGRGGAGGNKTTGSAADATGSSGGDSSIWMNAKDWMIAYGGGGGAAAKPGKDGGSGGGGSQTSAGTRQEGGKGTPGQGHDGGAGNASLYGGGGGGAGVDGTGKGKDASESGGGTGGDGIKSDITGADVWYAGGGGGGYIGAETIGSVIPGGKGGGGAGGYGKAVAPTPGDPCTGGGGGGCSALTFAGAAGGSGVVYVRISATMAGELVKPEKEQKYTYDGNAHTSVLASAFYELSGDNVGTEVGEYEAKVTLLPGVTWPGNDTESPVSVKMTIDRVQVKLGVTMEDWLYSPRQAETQEPVVTASPAWVKPVVEYATSTDAASWSTTKPLDVGSYWVRVRVPDTKNYSGEMAYDSFAIGKRPVEFQDLAQKDWMFGTPDDVTPRPRCTVTPEWVNPKYAYAPADSDEWSEKKPTEIGSYKIKVAPPNFDNYEIVAGSQLESTFRITKGLGGTFVDYVEITIDPWKGSSPSVLSDFPYKVTLSEDDLYGFEYARAGDDGQELGVTDADGEVLAYRVENWNVRGESVIYIRLPEIAAEPQTIRLYWMLREGATAPDHKPETVWEKWTREQVAAITAPDATYDLVVRNGYRVNRWLTKPTLTPTVWTVGSTPGVRTPGVLADGKYFERVTDSVTGETVSFPPAKGGSYRYSFILDNSTLEYEDLEYHIDFAVTDRVAMDDLKGDAPGLTENGRVLLANDDCAPGHEVTGQSYWHTDPEKLAIWWEHSGSHDSSSLYVPNLYKYPGKDHRLNYIDESGKTNLLWRLNNVILGNTFKNATLEEIRCFLPWSPTGLPISEDKPSLQGNRDESGWLVMRNTTDAVIYSPCYTNGIGTIYFDAVNTFAIQDASKKEAYSIAVDIATNVFDEADIPNSLPPTDENCFGKNEFGNEVEFGRLREERWMPVQMLPLKRDDNAKEFTRLEKTDVVHLDIVKGGSVSNFYRICVNLDYRGPVRFRIRRVAPVNGVINLYTAGIAIDNVLVSYPKTTANLRPFGVYDPEKTGKSIVGQEGAFSVAYPALTDGDIYGRATNDLYLSAGAKVDPKSVVLLSRLHYRWRYLNQASNDWQFVDLSPFDDFKATAPLKLPYDEGDVEFYYESFLNVPYYEYYDYSGANFGLGGLYTEFTGTQTNRLDKSAYSAFYGSGDDWFFRFRAGKSEWDLVSVIVKGAYSANVPMELIGDHLWRGLVKVPTNASGAVTFGFNAQYRREAGSPEPSESDRFWYPSADVPKMPWRGETLNDPYAEDPQHAYQADGASGYIEFQFNDETGMFMVGHAEYQSFNAWHDAHREDGKFVGNYAETSGVSVATMVQTNANMKTWTLHKTTDSNWNETFEMTQYDDEGYPKNTPDYISHKMPHQWTGENGIFVDAKLTTSNATEHGKSSGIAWQMKKEGAGSVSFTQKNLPNGLDTLSFKARLAQSIGFDDFAYWYGDGSSTLKNYTFNFPALLSQKNGDDFAPGASMSVVGYYLPRTGCYEFRITRDTSNGLLFAIYKWAKVNSKLTPTCVAQHWYKDAIFHYNCTDAKPDCYNMFISVGEEKTGQTTVIGGLSYERKRPDDNYQGINYRAIKFVDADTTRLKSGGFGALTANCNGFFLQPKHWTSFIPEANLAWNSKDWVENQQITFVNDSTSTTPTQDRKQLEGEQWGLTPGRIELFTQFYENNFTGCGIRPPTDLNQTVQVYLKAGDGGWELFKEVPVTSYGFADKPYEVVVRTNASCQVQLKTGPMPADVTVWQIEQKGWTGEDISGIDGISKDFVYTQARIIDEVDANKTTNRYAVLQPARALETKALSLRSPVLKGLGMAGFAYKNLKPGAEIWLQCVTNGTDHLSGTDGLNFSVKSADLGESLPGEAWITLRKYTYDELKASGEQAYYLGWHDRQDDPMKGVFRLFVPTNVVGAATAKALTDPDYGSITITDFYVHDEPAIDMRSWLGWNLRTIGDTADSEKRMFLPDVWMSKTPGEIGAGLSAGLNNSCTADIVGDPSLYDKENPCIQSPTFGRYETEGDVHEATIGQVRFRARVYGQEGDAPAKVTLYAVKDGTTRDWGEPVTNYLVSAGRYRNYEYRAPPNVRFAAVRLVVDGVIAPQQAGVQRVLLDEIVVSERSNASVGFAYARPFRTGLANDFVVADILDKSEQPLADESWGVQAQLKMDQFSDEIDVERGFRVTLRYFVGEKPWGYDNWMNNPAASEEAELMQVGAKSLYTFRSTATDSKTVVPAVREANSVVQYVLTAYYYEKGNAEEQASVIQVSNNEGEGWTNPTWYAPVDYNRNAAGEWKASVSPYTILDSIAPGRAWINEVNYNDGPRAMSADGKVSVSNQFIEIAVPWGVSMKNWRLRMTDSGENQFDIAVIGQNHLPEMKQSERRSGDYDFYVLQSPETRDAGGIRDPKTGEAMADGTWTDSTYSSAFKKGTLQYYEPYQIELIRPSGIVEHQFVLMGTNEYRGGRWAASYEGTNLLATLNADMPGPNRFYAGEELARLTRDPRQLASLGVTAKAHGEAGGWAEDMQLTPGRLNEGQEELVNWYIRPNGGACWVYLTVVGDHIAQRIGDDTARDTFVLVGEHASTNIVYTAEPWYQVDKVSVTVNGETNVTTAAKEGEYVFHLKDVTGTTYVVATDAISQRLVDAGLDPADRFTPAVMRWLQGGMADGQPFKNPGEIHKMTWRPEGVNDDSQDKAIGLKGMYWFDVDPTAGGWWLRGKTVNFETVRRTWYSAHGQTPFDNVLVRVKLYLSNETENVVFSPKRLQGVGGERSDDLGSYSNWTSETFKIEGKLENGREHNLGYLPFRWFVFDAGSFEPKGSANEFTTLVELLDPYSQASPGYSYGWSEEKGKGYASLFRWNITEALEPTGVSVLKKDDTYGGKPPFVDPTK